MSALPLALAPDLADLDEVIERSDGPCDHDEVTIEDLLAWMAERNISQRELARLLNVHWMTVSYWVLGKRALPSSRTLILALTALDLELKLKRLGLTMSDIDDCLLAKAVEKQQQ